jgi:hypothetical protein
MISISFLYLHLYVYLYVYLFLFLFLYLDNLRLDDLVMSMDSRVMKAIERPCICSNMYSCHDRRNPGVLTRSWSRASRRTAAPLQGTVPDSDPESQYK